MIPVVWKEYTCTVSGGTVKFVECEECRQKFVYYMVRQAQGQGSSLYFLDNVGAEGRAQSAAQSSLQKQLTSDCDAIPCPKCNKFQEEMVARLKRNHRIWMYWTGLLSFFVAVITGSAGWIMFNHPNAGVSGVVVLCLAPLIIGLGIGLIVCRKMAASVLEPNSLDPATRLAMAEGTCEAVDSFEKWLKQNGIELSDDDVGPPRERRRSARDWE
jgi:hypothetical protein